MSFPVRYVLAAAFLTLLSLHVASQQDVALSIIPDKIEFPDQTVGDTGQTQSVTLSNPNSSAVVVSNILISGIDFSQSNNCDQPIVAGGNCSVAVLFKPAVSGTRLGALQISWSRASSPRTIPLSGTGLLASKPIQP